MASLLQWAKKRLQDVEHTVGNVAHDVTHNPVTDVIGRDVVQPVGQAVSNVAPAVPDIVNTALHTADQFHVPTIPQATGKFLTTVAPHIPTFSPTSPLRFANNAIINPIKQTDTNVGKLLQGHNPYRGSTKQQAGQALQDITNVASVLPIGRGAEIAVKGAPLIPRIAEGAKLGAKAGAAFGGAQGLSQSLKTNQNLPQTLKNVGINTAIGGAGGAVLGGGAPIVVKGVEKAVVDRTPLNEVGGIKRPSLPNGKPPKTPLTPEATPKVSGQGSGMVHGKTPSMTARVMQDNLTPPQVSENLGGHYIVKPNKQTLAKATQEINANPEAAVSRILGPKYKPTTHNHAVAMLLAEKARTAGNYDQMTNILERVGNEASNPGQAIQILSQWGKSTPTGIVKYAQKVVREGHALPDGTPTKNLTADQAKQFGNRMEQIQKMAEGRDKNLATASLLQDIHNLAPASVGSKLRNTLYYAQLLNPKTAIRNIGGNTIFGGAENLSDTLGAPIDKALSLITKKRTVYAPDISGQVKVGIRGAKEAAQEAKLGVNLSGTTGQYEAYGRPPAFNNPVGRGLDTALAVELSTPDRFALSGAQYQSLKNQLRASGVDKKLLTPDKIWAAKLGKDVGIPVDQNMIERAGELGKYRTFQDNSVPAKIMTGLKSTLNLGKSFGAGNFVMNYPKTPGNLLARGLDFSPAGFIKTAIELGKPAFGRGFNQEQFVRSLSRSLTGSVGLVGTGAALNQLGIISGRPDPNKNVNAADKLLGLGQYKINTSALKRFIVSGLKPSAAKLRPGDTLVSYDWAQPASFALTMGANINQTKGTNKGAVAKISNSLGKGAGEIVDAMNSLAEQPVLQGLQTLTGSSGAGLTTGLIQTAASAPSGFVPTILNQINQLIDNTSRSSYSPNPLVSGIKKVEAKIPGIASTLQPQVNVLGQPAERYQGGTNNPLNVFLNPAFVSKYAPQNVLDEAVRLQNSTSETKQFPKQVAYSQKVNGKNQQLTPEQLTQLQTFVGQNAGSQLSKIIQSQQYKSANDTEKVNMLSSALTSISQAGRAVVLGNKSKLTANAASVASGGDVVVGQASDPKTKYQQALAAFNRDQSTYSQVRKDKEQQKLAKLKVASSYSQDVLDLYGESKSKTYNYITTHNDGKKLADQLLAYDKALYDAGLSSSLKYKNGLAPAAKGSRRTARGGSKSSKTPFITTGFKTASQLKIPKPPKGVAIKTPKYKKTTVKKIATKKIPVTKRKLA